MASSSAQFDSSNLSQSLQHSQGNQAQQQQANEIRSRQQVLNGNTFNGNGMNGSNNSVSPKTTVTNGLPTVPGISFNDPAALVSVLGHQQHLLQHQMPIFTQQALGHILPLQQIQVQQLQQQPATTVDNKGSSLVAVPSIQQADPQFFWQHAIQSLAGGQVVQAPAFGGLSNALSQQQQQFQQLMSSLPMPTDLTQLALMYPLQQPTQNGISQQPSQSFLQPAQYQMQAAQVGKDTSSGSISHVLQPVQSNVTNVHAAGSTINRTSNETRISASANSSHTRTVTDTKSGPSIVSFNSNCDFGFEKPPERKSDMEIAKMTESERRRYERNLREQQRSYKISQQIKELRDVLAESNVPFRPNKYSILVSVAEYIKQLQSRAIMLDAEHQRLIDTIRKTNELVSSGEALSLSDAEDCNTNGRFTTQLQQSQQSLGTDLLLVQGIDYRTLFEHCPYPMGIATLDGRVLAANKGFEELLCCAQGQMADQSLFVYIRNHQEIFEAMAALLKRSSLAVETDEGTCNDQQLLYWCGHVLSPRNQMVRHFCSTYYLVTLTEWVLSNFYFVFIACVEQVPLTITLTSTSDNNPKFFSLSAAVASSAE